MSEKSLKALGISSIVIGSLVLIGMVGFAYKNFYDLQLTKLRILEAQKALGLPMDNHLIKQYLEKMISNNDKK